VSCALGVGLRDALVLAQMLGPGFDHEPFDDALWIGNVLADTPREGAVAPSLQCEPGDGGKERGAESPPASCPQD